MITVGGTVLSAGPSGLVIWGSKSSSTANGISRVRPTTTIRVGGKVTQEATASHVSRSQWTAVLIAIIAAGAAVI